MQPAAAPRANAFTPPLTPGSGLMPVTAGYTAAVASWSSAWGSAVSSFVSATRALQASVGGNAAEFGSAQLRGFGSARNMDYIAKRWAEAGDRYKVGGKGQYKWVDQAGSGIIVGGISEWLKIQDVEMRQKVAREMDRKVAAYCYRAVFFEHVTVTFPAQDFTRPVRFHGKITGEKTTHLDARAREYIGSPVASGYSRSHMSLEWILRGDDLVGQFVSRAPYTLVAPATRAWWAAFKKGMKVPILSAVAAIEASNG